MKGFTLPGVITVMTWVFLHTNPASAATPAQLAAEAQGLAQPETGQSLSTPRTRAKLPALASKSIPDQGLLLIPDSGSDRVMAFDPLTGDLIDPDFIPADPANLSTPINAILSADGQRVLVSDQIDDVVQAYDLQGNYQGVFAPAGGVDTSILENIRGMTLAENGNVLVTVASGTNADSVAEFHKDTGAYLGNFIDNNAGGMDSPFDIVQFNGGFLVGGIGSDALHQYDSTGTYLADLATINSFPEQLNIASNGNILISNFSGTQAGVVELTPAGTLVGIYDSSAQTGSGLRGVYELPNTNLLITTSSGVYEIDRSGALVDTKISGVNARFIEFAPSIEPLTVPTLSPLALTILASGLLLLALLAGRRVRH